MIRQFIAALLGLLLVTTSVSAQTAGMVSFQGRLKTSGSQPVSGSVTLEFRIYDAVSGGNLVDMDGDGLTCSTTNSECDLGQDVKQVIVTGVSDGLISTKFGPVAPTAFNGSQRWLEVTITDPPPTSTLPRVEMATPPATAEQLNARGTGTPAVITLPNGNVGIGQASLSSQFTVFNNSGGQEILAQFSGAGNSQGGDSNAYVGLKHALATFGWNLKATPSGDFAIHQHGWGDRLFISGTNGAVGIGTSDPAAKLDIDSTSGILLERNTPGYEDTRASISISSNFGPPGLRFLMSSDDGATNSDTLFLTNTGHVGIGTANPRYPFHVVASNPDDAVASIHQTHSNGYGLELVPGIDNRYALSITNANNDTQRHLFYGDGRALLAIGEGNVGIGTLSPSTKLTVEGPISAKALTPGGQALIALNTLGNRIVDLGSHGSNNGMLRIFESTGTTDCVRLSALQSENMWFNNGGNVGIGTDAPSAKLEVAGSIIASGCTGCSSDQRLKKNIAAVTAALDKLLSLRGVWFNWKDPKRHGDEHRRQMGLIAQEVEKVLPEWVLKDEKGYRYLNTGGFPALAIEAMREMKSENDALKGRVTKLEERLVQLEKAMNAEGASYAKAH